MSANLLYWAAFLVAVYFLVWPAYSALVFVRPPRQRSAFRTPADSGFAYHPARFTSRDGAALEGWYLPSHNGAAVILLHGHGGNRQSLLAPMEALAGAGFGVLLFDLRAHGRSEGRRFVRGDLLIADVMAALAFVRRQPDVRPWRVGVMGLAVGGMIALQAAARSGHLRAVVADGPTPADLADHEGQSTVAAWLNWPRQQLHESVLGWLSGGATLSPTTAVIGRIAPRPLLLIANGQGEQRRRLRRYHAAAGEPKTLWELPDAYHVGGWLNRRELAYHQRIVRFFREALVDKAP